MRIIFANAAISIATVKYSKNILLYSVMIWNTSFLSREDICRAREKCDTLGELFFFHQYDFMTENIWEYQCREKNLLAVSQKIDKKFKPHRQRQWFLISYWCSLLACTLVPGCCSFCVNLLHTWGTAFDLSATVFTVIHGNTWKFILFSFYIRIQFCRFSRVRYNVWPTTQLFCKRRKWIECCFYYSTWAWTCVSTYFLAGNFFLKFPFKYDWFSAVGFAFVRGWSLMCSFRRIVIFAPCSEPGREIVNFITWLVSWFLGKMSKEINSVLLSYELVGALGHILDSAT